MNQENITKIKQEAVNLSLGYYQRLWLGKKCKWAAKSSNGIALTVRDLS